MRHPEEFRPGRADDPYLHFRFGKPYARSRKAHCRGPTCRNAQDSSLLLPGIRRALGTAGELRYEGLLPESFTIVFDRPVVKREPWRQPKESAQPVQKTPLTAIMTIKSPEDVHSTALQKLVVRLFPKVKAILDKVGTVHFARFVFLDSNTKFGAHHYL